MCHTHVRSLTQVTDPNSQRFEQHRADSGETGQPFRFMPAGVPAMAAGSVLRRVTCVIVLPLFFRGGFSGAAEPDYLREDDKLETFRHDRYLHFFLINTGVAIAFLTMDGTTEKVIGALLVVEGVAYVLYKFIKAKKNKGKP